MYGQLLRHNGLLGLISKSKIRQNRVARLPCSHLTGTPSPSRITAKSVHSGKVALCTTYARHKLKQAFHGPADPSQSGARLLTQHTRPVILRPPLPYKGYLIFKKDHFLSQFGLLQTCDWWERDKCRQGRLALYALFSFSQEERYFSHIIMSSSMPLATLTAHPNDQSGPSALSEKPPSHPSPPQAEPLIHPDAESSAMAASVIADGQSTATENAIEKADLEPWRL